MCLLVALALCLLAHALLAHSPAHTDAQACKDGYTVQGIYCGKCSGSADPTVKLLAAPLGTSLILFIFGSWCLRPYFAKTEAKIRRMASEQGARLTSSITRHFTNYRNELARDVQMKVGVLPRVTSERLRLHRNGYATTVAGFGVACAHTLTPCTAHATQVRRGDLTAATEGVREERVSTARDVFGLNEGGAAQTTVSSSTDSLFSTLRRLAKVVVSLGQVISSFTRV
jgi:hypothetical protein